LRRRERAVAEELLDDAQVGAALQEVRGKRVAQAMGVGEQAAQRARVEPSPARRYEEGVLRSADEARARVLEIAAKPVRGFLAKRHDPLLAALAQDADRLLLEVDVREIEPDRLRAA